jgi:hypothetical protein
MLNAQRVVFVQARQLGGGDQGRAVGDSASGNQ